MVPRRACRAAALAFSCGAAAVLALAFPTPAGADTLGGWAAADAALRMANAGATYAGAGGDIRLVADAWTAAGARIPSAGALAAAADPSGRVGGGRGDAAALTLASAACGGAVSWTWEVDHANQPGRGDLVLYRPPPGADGLPAAYRVGIVVTQTEVVVVEGSAGAARAVAVRRELLFHAMRALPDDTAVADPTAETGFCRVSPALMPPAMRRTPSSSGRVRLVDPTGTVDTLEWNAGHPHDRDGNSSVLRMVEILSFLGAGSGILFGVVVFGGALVHDGSGGILRAMTSVFAAVRWVLTLSFDGSVAHRVLVVALLAAVGWKLGRMPPGLAVGLAVGVGAAAALQLATRGRVPVATIIAAFVWSLASYAVGALTGIDGTGHDSVVTVALALLGGVAIVAGGGKLGALLGPLGAAIAKSAAGRRVAVAGVWVRDHPVTVAFRDLPPVRVAVHLTKALATAGQGALARVGNILGAKVSAFFPSATEASHAASRLAGEAMAAETAPRTVAEAVSSARAAAIGTPSLWAVVRGDAYSVALRGVDVATWFTWRGASVVGDLLSMQGELAEWVAGRLSHGQLTHPFVQALDSLLGHLEPAARQRLVDVTLPALADVSRLGNLHTGGQLAGGLLTGRVPLPHPVPTPPSVTPADVEATWRRWLVAAASRATE